MAEPIIHWRAQAQALSIIEDSPAALILRIRDTGAGQQHGSALSRAFAVPWPDAPNTCARCEGATIAWLAPGEWAIIGLERELVHARVEAVCSGRLHHLADMSHAWRRWRIVGEEVDLLLAGGCSLDLHLSAFGVDRCARTLLGQIGVLLMRQGEGWSVHAESALAAHLRAWWLRAGREAGLVARSES